MTGLNGVHAFQRTMQALLMCLKCRRPQLHTYHSMRLVKTDDDGPISRPVENVMYECSNCSTHRVWGHETRW
jgi:hypothetical protein